MKKLNLPFVADEDILAEMAVNNQLASYPYLLTELRTIQAQYNSYLIHSGNPHHCVARPISDELKTALGLHYSDPPNILEYIKMIRDRGSPRVCPMCGSPKTGSIDHFYPKADYPEWSVFSPNLVPSCDCNSKRTNIIRGANPLERIFHPYFDTCLNTRLISCSFTGSLDLPIIDLVNINGDITVGFHLDNVIRKSTIISWLEDKWEQLETTPEIAIYQLPRSRMINVGDIQQALSLCLSDSDRTFGTPNNWESIFYHGLINTHGMLNWIANRRNGILTNIINPFAPNDP